MPLECILILKCSHDFSVQTMTKNVFVDNHFVNLFVNQSAVSAFRRFLGSFSVFSQSRRRTHTGTASR